jgi:hypothetical protein
MDGFVSSNHSDQPMGYWTAEVLPFAYSFATSFTVANRWFCSAPCQTYPNRRFLMAGTAYGDIATDLASLQEPPPPNGTIFDRLHAYGVSWRNYFTDLPQTAIIEKYPTNLSGTCPRSPIATPTPGRSPTFSTWATPRCWNPRPSPSRLPPQKHWLAREACRRRSAQTSSRSPTGGRGPGPRPRWACAVDGSVDGLRSQSVWSVYPSPGSGAPSLVRSGAL